jgi:hypothetical protein
MYLATPGLVLALLSCASVVSSANIAPQFRRAVDNAAAQRRTAQYRIYRSVRYTLET